MPAGGEVTTSVFSADLGGRCVDRGMIASCLSVSQSFDKERERDRDKKYDDLGSSFEMGTVIASDVSHCTNGDVNAFTLTNDGILMYYQIPAIHYSQEDTDKAGGESPLVTGKGQKRWTRR